MLCSVRLCCALTALRFESPPLSALLLSCAHVHVSKHKSAIPQVHERRGHRVPERVGVEQSRERSKVEHLKQCDCVGEHDRREQDPSPRVPRPQRPTHPQKRLSDSNADAELHIPPIVEEDEIHKHVVLAERESDWTREHERRYSVSRGAAAVRPSTNERRIQPIRDDEVPTKIVPALGPFRVPRVKNCRSRPTMHIQRCISCP
mmetsp:Transcript_3068/g.11147  ORF Transcript_3068/g.11147 Transcript_3068/m.11147 type:complete len:204 (-) Transcript_3068:81-692(-)